MGDSKLPIGVSVSGCLSLYVGPQTDRQPVLGVPRRLPNDSWGRLQPLHDPDQLLNKNIDKA